MLRILVAAILVAFSLTSSDTNPVLHIDAVTRLPHGATLQLCGMDFSPCSVVRWNGADRPTTFVSTAELRTAIATSDLTTGGTRRSPPPESGWKPARRCHTDR